MKYLLDTHYLVWAITDTKKISDKIKALLVDRDQQIIISAVSFWEISLKTSFGKLQIEGFLPEDMPGLCSKIGFDIEPLSAKDCSSCHNLKGNYHKDPFDRMLIWTAISNNYIFISADANIKKYTSEGLKIFK